MSGRGGGSAQAIGKYIITGSLAVRGGQSSRVGRVFKTSKAERAVQSLADTFRSVFRTLRAPDDLGSLLANPALVFRPRRGYACHAGISDKLPHVLVAVNDQAEIDGIGCGDSLEKVNPSLQLFGAFLGPRVARSI